MDKVEVSDRQVALRGDDGALRWTYTTPYIAEWRQFNQVQRMRVVDGRVVGQFLYADLVPDGVVVTYAVSGGMDWNLWLDARTGHLRQITESR